MATTEKRPQAHDPAGAVSDSGPVRGRTAAVRAVRGIILVSALVLTACSGPSSLDPRDAAIRACKEMAVSQYDLPGAGETEVRELAVEEGDSFDVTGAFEGTEWVCRWTSTRGDGGHLIETTIDTR